MIAADTVATRTDAYMIDPFGLDDEAETVLTVTPRQLVRLAVVATETATRFERDGVGVEPMAWMLSPRRLFEGRSPMEACLGRADCLRAIVLHALRDDLDADPSIVEGLDGWIDEDPAVPASSGRELFSAALVAERRGSVVHAFVAALATSEGEFRDGLARRYGAVALEANVSRGFDPDLPLSEALVSPALADMLSQIAAFPASPLADGFDVTVEQRFAA